MFPFMVSLVIFPFFSFNLAYARVFLLFINILVDNADGSKATKQRNDGANDARPRRWQIDQAQSKTYVHKFDVLVCLLLPMCMRKERGMNNEIRQILRTDIARRIHVNHVMCMYAIVTFWNILHVHMYIVPMRRWMAQTGPLKFRDSEIKCTHTHAM